MERCSKKVTENLNDSVHSKLWRKVLKYKKHGKERFIFCCIQVIMEHNFGHDSGSLLYCLDSMTKMTKYDLVNRDKDSVYVAKRKHQLIDGGGRTKHRKKTNVKSSYDPGMEPIE